MDELQQIKLQLAEERRRRAEAEERARSDRIEREEEQRRREEEQRRREHAENVAASALNQDLATFLKACHGLCRLVKPVTDLSLATTGSVTNETGRLYPRVILPWTEFPERQRSVWQRLALVESVWNSPVYPSAANLDYLRTWIDPIGSEEELRFLDRVLVEDMVKRMFEKIPNEGEISFENQARFRGAEMIAATDDMSVRSDTARQPRNTRADNFCVLRNKDGIARPVVAIEYKAPHKLTIREICTGLQGEIRPEVDVMDKVDDSFEFLCKHLMAAVLTQLFSYMIDKGVRNGYVSTGEAYIFLHIPADTTTVYYSVNVPREDFEDDAENRLERTAVSQVFAFVQNALEDDPPDQAWIASARNQLKRWKVEVIDILQMIPETERQSRDHSAYKPGRWAPSHRISPIKLRSRCGDNTTTTREPESESDDDNGGGDVASPSAVREARSRASHATATTKSKGKNKTGGRGGAQEGKENQEVVRRPIELQEYCTHKCLQGMCQGLPLDPDCPNVTVHRRKHILPQNFLRLIRQQLEIDRGKDADCCALHIHGSRGALLKVRLTSHGYTLVAKGVERCSFRYLQTELWMYERLRNLQGRYVPVCCGLTELNLPFYYDGSELTHLLFMSWGGRSLAALTRDDRNDVRSTKGWIQQCQEALAAIHHEGMLHCDLEPRNMLYDEKSKRLMIIDFERSEVQDRQTLGELSPNSKRKHLHGPQTKKPIEASAREASLAAFSILKAFSS